LYTLSFFACAAFDPNTRSSSPGVLLREVRVSAFALLSQPSAGGTGPGQIAVVSLHATCFRGIVTSLGAPMPGLHRNRRACRWLKLFARRHSDSVSCHLLSRMQTQKLLPPFFRHIHPAIEHSTIHNPWYPKHSPSNNVSVCTGRCPVLLPARSYSD
jgi:hypothetical protein